ncbi:alpha/beta hydrolase [Kineococcus terrestris]|uniref:alpha/beta hydrolase n=1 Tax=Kineococcus terrestris TaxID=2044856 RepID=UPI0034DAF297
MRTTRPPRPALPLAAGLAAALLLTGCSAFDDGPDPVPVATATAVAGEPADDPALAPFYEQRLTWTDCQGGFECSRLSVPLDHDDPAAGTTSLALVRLPAGASGEDRLGSLVLNPGGPGGSGVEYARLAQGVVSDAVRAHFDVVGFDPRGVGQSEPLRCVEPAQLDEFLAADATPDDPAEVERWEELSRGLGEACADDPLAPHVDTGSVARDLDVLRAALGDDKLSYLGKSYGTSIGAAYADLFPGRVGRFVLDGAIDPSLSSEDVDLGQAQGFETALRAYVEDCLSDSGCPLRGSVDDGVAQVRALLDSLDAAPLGTGTDRELTQGLGYYGLAQPLYLQSQWPDLSDALTAAFRGDGAPLLAFADAYSRRGEDGEYTDNLITAIYAVNCLDRGEVAGVADVAAAAEDLAGRAPTFGPFLAWASLPCAEWPFPAASAPAPVTAEGADPIVVVGTTRDPATPYVWAQGLAEQLSSGVLLTFDGDGHTAYRMGVSACVDEAVDAYLVGGQVPEDGTRC